MKRKRGRPKGSTKKSSAEEELAESLVSPGEDSPLAPEEGSSPAPSSLECSKCCRKFSNMRQLRKHICIIVLNLGEEDGEAGKGCRGPSVCVSHTETQLPVSVSSGSVLSWKYTYLYRSHPSGKVYIFVMISDYFCK